MELEGNLSTSMAMGDVLQFLGLGNMSGVLNFTASSAGAGLSVSMYKGKIFNISTLDDPEVISHTLVCYGYIDRAQYYEIVEQYKNLPASNRPRSILTYMVMQQRLNKDIVGQVLQRTLEDQIFKLFLRKDGSFYFEKHPPESMEVPNQSKLLEVDQVIIEGTRRADEWERYMIDIPSMSLIPQIKTLSRVALQTSLSPSVWRTLSFVNNTRSVASICDLAGIGTFMTVRSLHELMTAGIIEMGKPSFEPDQLRAKYGVLYNYADEKDAKDNPVSMLTDMVNDLAAEAKFDGLEACWAALVAQYPYSDLIIPSDKGLNAVLYAKMLGRLKDDAHLAHRLTLETMLALKLTMQEIIKAFIFGTELVKAQNSVHKLIERYRQRALALEASFGEFHYDNVMEQILAANRLALSSNRK